MPRRPGAVHIGGDWYARRGGAGTVTLWAGDDREITLTPASWAALVGALSSYGPGRVGLRAAAAVHEGNPHDRKETTDGRR